MVDSRKDAKPPSVAASGRTRTVGGGISPERIFRATFSHISACAGTSARSSPSSDRPAVFSLSLWQDTQYVVVSFAYSAGGGCGFVSAGDFAGACARAGALDAFGDAGDWLFADVGVCASRRPWVDAVAAIPAMRSPAPTRRKCF